MSSDELVQCSIISVDCVPNDPVDIRCGGPVFLGFDFAVKEDETQEMMNLITECLNNNDVPLSNIGISSKVSKPANKVWTKETIEKEIIKDAKYLRSEAKMGYTKKYYRD